MIAFVFLAFIHLAFAGDLECTTSIPPDRAPPGWILSRMSAAYLQIFRMGPIHCTGFVESWLFQSDNPSATVKPIFTVWEQYGTENKFRFIGGNMLGSTVENVGNQWYRFYVDKNSQIPVDVTKGGPYYIGIFYESTQLMSGTYVPIFYYDNVQEISAFAPDMTVIANVSAGQVLDLSRMSQDGWITFPLATLDRRSPLLFANFRRPQGPPEPVS